MAAPKPRPAALKLLEGRGPGRDSGGRAVKQPPGFVRLPPEAPSWLGLIAREEWERVVPELQRLQLTKQIDASALAAYCETVELFVRAAAQMQSEPLTIESRSKKDGVETVMVRANPVVQVFLNAQAQIRSWCSEYGLTPSAEAKVSKPEVSDGKEADPFSG